MKPRTRRTLAVAIAAATMSHLPAAARTPVAPLDALAGALRNGGHVIVMRHASSPREAPTAQAANGDNVRLERQLDETGRAGAIAMGEAWRALKIPIGAVLSSPTYRALETVRLAQLPQPRIAVELGDGGRSMQGVTDEQAAWLRKLVTELPTGTNTLAVTHMPNLARAFPEARDVAEGEALVFGADGTGASALIGRISIEDWPRLRP